MARIVTQDVIVRISKVVKDDADEQDQILTAADEDVITAVIDELGDALDSGVVERVFPDHIPNEDTVEAIKESRAGKVTKADLDDE